MQTITLTDLATLEVIEALNYLIKEKEKSIKYPFAQDVLNSIRHQIGDIE